MKLPWNSFMFNAPYGHYADYLELYPIEDSMIMLTKDEKNKK